MKTCAAFLLLLCQLTFGQEKISVIVPCYYGHFKYLAELMDALTLQTRLPDEVVISLSEVEKIPTPDLQAFESLSYPFPVKLIKHTQQLYAGENRNSACQQAIGDILVTQDADDIPHPQRLEAIEYAFSRHNIPMVLHRWIRDPNQLEGESDLLEPYTVSEIPIHTCRGMSELEQFDFIHHGNIAIRRQVFESVKWSGRKRGQDYEFVRNVLKKFRRCDFVDAVLIIYRPQLSSFPMR